MMTDREEILNVDNGLENCREILGKWLKFLYYVQIAGVALAVLAAFQLLGTLPQILSLALLGCVVFVMHQLSGVNAHYRKAFIWGAVNVAGTVVGLIFENSLLSLAVSIASLVAVYQQYQGHSAVTDKLDSVLSHKWNSLFLWEIAVGLLGSILSVLGAMAGVGFGMDTGLLTAIIVIVVSIPGVAMELLYLSYLKKTLALFAE